jgi:hypothetical protein
MGPGCVLFRGENLDRWTNGIVGLCWTVDVGVARGFACARNAVSAGGVLLKCFAPENAIIAGPCTHSRYLNEMEYTLDVSMISRIDLIENFPPSDLY